MNSLPYNELDYAESNTIVRDYVCSQCWGSLTSNFLYKDGKKFYEVFCSRCGVDKGFVTRDYATRRKAESNAEATEAARNLGKTLGIEKKPFDREKAIKDLYPD